MGHLGGQNDGWTRFVAVLEIPPVDSPETAVKMAIYSDIKRGNFGIAKKEGKAFDIS
jgi:hypothetical protein